MTVSVVMGTYNGARYVEEQLDSILAQTHPPIEVVVADDGSSDGTVAVVKRIAERSTVPIVVIENPVQLGFADNFLAASRIARGDFVAFSDQDDRWEPRKLELSVAALQQHDAVYCSHAVRLMDERGQDLGTTAQDVPHDTVVEPRTADPWGARYGFTVTVRRELLELLPASDRGVDTFALTKPLSHDRWSYVLAWSVGRAVYLSTPLASYRQHGRQLFGGPRPVTRLEQVARIADENQRRMSLLAEVALSRSRMFASVDESWAAVAASQHWKRLAVAYGMRHSVYASPTLFQRASHYADAWRTGVYRSQAQQGVGLKHSLNDALFGLPGMRVRARLVRTLQSGTRHR